MKYMQKSITLRDQTILYTLRHSRRARRIRLVVYGDGSVVLTSPVGVGENIAERFIREKAEWLVSKLNYFKKKRERRGGKNDGDQPAAPLLPRLTRRDYLKYKEQARLFMTRRIEELNVLHGYGYAYHRISIKNQRTCWGSCSRKRNLNFNYKILFLPERAQDYILVHELCHLAEFNHSKKFWALVARASPDYAEIRRELKQRGGLR